MKKILVFTIVCLGLVQLATAQSIYSVFNYKKPIGYKEEKKQGFISYTKFDDKKGTYCIIGLYEQTQTSATINESFTANW
jgi:hypothetical protein